MDEDATESEFDSSDSANDTDSEDGILEEDDKDSDEEKEWGGIASDRDSQGDLKDRNQATDVQQPSSSQSGSEDSEEESGSEDDDEDQPKRQKGSFKAWAQAQRDQLEGHVQSETPAITQVPQANGTTTSKRRNSVTLPEGLGPLGEVFKAPTNSLALSGPQSTIKQRTVTVDRPEELQEARMQLPVLAEEDNIMHLIRHHSVMVLSGETGSGKTTQVPQFLYEAGFGDPAGDNPGMIGITQPRRVAAVSMAQRVRSELALPSHSHVVAHQVRYDSTTARETRIKFMTDGVLLRELGQDFLLQKYSVIIVDEAHERTVNTDILLGVLSRVVKLREDMWRKQEQGVKVGVYLGSLPAKWLTISLFDVAFETGHHVCDLATCRFFEQ